MCAILVDKKIFIMILFFFIVWFNDRLLSIVEKS